MFLAKSRREDIGAGQSICKIGSVPPIRCEGYGWLLLDIPQVKLDLHWCFLRRDVSNFARNLCTR